MNYLFTGPAIAFAAQSKVDMSLVETVDYAPYPALDANAYAEKIEALLDLYDWEIQQTQLNLLSSHDIARVLSVVNNDKASMALATLLLLTFPGAPSIYYGDEVGLAGGLDPDCRWVFPDKAQWDTSLLQTHKDLIALRHAHPALRTGRYQTLAAEGLCYVFSRVLDGEMMMVAVNAGEQSAQIQLTDRVMGQGQVLYGDGKVEWRGDSLLEQLRQRAIANQSGHKVILQIPARSGMGLGNQAASG